MQYSNFIMKNNVHATLSTALSSVATTIQLTTGQWSRFWTEFPQIATLESFDDTWKVVKREIVQITARNDDDLTVVRAFAPCPANDDANSQTQSSVSFSADDQISLYIPKEIFDKISKSMNDIYDNGTNNMRTDLVSWLQVEVNPWSVLVWSAYYDFAGWTITLTDNATNYLEIDEDWNLANNTTSRNDQNTKLAIITTANGSVTNIQDWRLWTVGWKIGWVNIHDLTEKKFLSPNDEFIITDSENIFQNKKVKYSSILINSKIDYSVWEDINAWDVLELVNWITTIWSATESVDFGKTDKQTLSKSAMWSWNVGNNLLIRVWKIFATDDVKVRIETDSGWVPSWTLADANAEYTINNANISTEQNWFPSYSIAWSAQWTHPWYYRVWNKFTVTDTIYINWITCYNPNNYNVNFKLWTVSWNTYTITNTENGLTKWSSTWIYSDVYEYTLWSPIKLTPWEYIYFGAFENNWQIVNTVNHARRGGSAYWDNMSNVVDFETVISMDQNLDWSIVTEHVFSYDRPLFVVPTLTDINVDLSNLTLTNGTTYHIVIKRSWTNSNDNWFCLAKENTWTLIDKLYFNDWNWRDVLGYYYWVANSLFTSKNYIKATQIVWWIKIAIQDTPAWNLVPYVTDWKIGTYSNLVVWVSYYLDQNNAWKITNTPWDYYVGEALTGNIIYINGSTNLPVYIWDWSQTSFTIKRSWKYKVSCMFWRDWTSTSLQNYAITFQLNWTTIEDFNWRYPQTKIWKWVFFDAKCWDILSITTTWTSVSISQLIIERLIVEEWFVE